MGQPFHSLFGEVFAGFPGDREAAREGGVIVLRVAVELRIFVNGSVAHRGRNVECGGKRSATPLSEELNLHWQAGSKSGVAASLCHRTPNEFFIAVACR